MTRLSELAAQARQRQRGNPLGKDEGERGAHSAIDDDQARDEGPRRLCRDCEYDLTGIDWSPAACPECGREFDPRDHSTTKPEGELGRVRRVVGSYGPPIAIGLVLLAAFQSTILPRPADLRDWRLWKWLGGLYGVEMTPGSAYRGWGAPYPGAPRGAVHWWGERPWRVEATTRDGTKRWEIERIDERTWRVDVHEAGVPCQDLMASFTAIKPEMFGVTIGPPGSMAIPGQGQFSYSRSGGPPLPPTFETPESKRGSTVDIFSWLVRESEVAVTPFMFKPDQRYVWVYDERLGRMVAVTPDEADERGIPISVDHRFLDRPIVPKPEDGPAS